MSHTIWKYRLGKVDDLLKGVEVTMVESAKILDAKMVEGAFFVWALADLQRVGRNQQRRFQACGTGWEINLEMPIATHLGTFQEGGFVWHLFTD